MEEFVAYIIKNLVASPESVSVKSIEEEDRICLEVHVAADDVGKVIGRRGNTINSLRTIVRTVATRLGKRAQIELIQPDKVIVEECDSDECCESECDEALDLGEPALT